MSGDLSMDGNGLDDDFDAAMDEAAQYSNPDEPPQVDPMAALSQALATSVAHYHRRRRTLFEWMDPQRIAAFPYAACLPKLDERRSGQLAEAFLGSAGSPPAPLLSFGEESATLLRLLLQDCLSVFRLRALLEHADELRSWIDRPRRMLLNEWLGPDLLRMLLAQRSGFTGGNLPLDGQPSAQTLAWRGFRLFERECGWAADHPMMLVQFALPDDCSLLPPDQVPGQATVSNASRTLVSQLPELFPALSW